MAFEIFISRGVADIERRKSPTNHTPYRPEYDRRAETPPKPLCHAKATGAQAKNILSGSQVLAEQRPWTLASPGSSSVAPGMTPMGHARPNASQFFYGAKSDSEIFRTEADGRISETYLPLVSTSEYRVKQGLLSLQRWNNSHDDQSPQDDSGSLLSANPGVPNPQFLNQSTRESTGPVVPCSPPNLSDSSTKWTGSKVYGHATNSAVAFVDGNLDAPRLGGEYSSATKTSSRDVKVSSERCSPPLITHSTPPSRRITTMSSSGKHHDAPSFLFLDPFQGLPLELERQASDLSDLSGYVRPQAFSRHRDTLARVSWSHNHAKHDEDEGFHSDDGENLISKSRHQDMIVQRRTSYAPTAAYVPAEILQQIFALLQPCDFEAARHTCRPWFIASLDQRLSYMMMKRAGCYLAFLTDLSRFNRPLSINNAEIGSPAKETPALETSKQKEIHQHWLASKRLATESRLSAAWHGSSLSTNNGHSSSRLAICQTVDFTNIMSTSALRKKAESDTFTVSTCGKFVLVTSDRDVYVYSIDAELSTFQPLVRLVAESKVLAVSMDTSASRFAVAALLEGRVGVCWEIDDLIFNGVVGSLCNSITEHNQTDEEILSSSAVLPEPSIPLSNSQDEISIISEGVDLELPSSIQFQSLDTPSERLTASPESITPSTTWTPTSFPIGSPHSAIPVRVKPSAIYRNLGTKNDAPRSVAICPQRKCAAFGCRSGIELHWVDALTGADLNRWFPLAAPSDHLYFLPQRAGIDSAKKLRLISSATNPNLPPKESQQDPASSSSNSSDVSARTRARSMTKLFHGNRRSSLLRNSAGQSTTTSPNQRSQYTMNYDHYRAVPLSDGQHMLFTDPTTGLLCLGSDAPLGGPTKFVRKVCLVPPHTQGTNQFESPTYYTASSDLRWGVRIVAAYDDGRIVLFNIPSDCFERLRYIRSSPEVWDEWNNTAGQSDLMMDAFMLNRETAIANIDEDNNTVFKSLQIDGALLGYVDADVEAIAVDGNGGGMKLWVFHASGQATQMDIFVPAYHQMSSRVVEASGMIHDKLLTPPPRAILKGHTNTPYEDGRHREDDYFGSHVRFVGLDGCCDHQSGSMCGPMVHKHENDFTDFYRDEGISMTPGASDDEGDERPLQVELLTDWRAESLLRPYIVNVAWIDAH